MDEKHKAELKSFVRIAQLERCPIAGNFDLPHLLQIHAFIFQDSPASLPGQLRPHTASWVKCRALECENVSYHVTYYAGMDLAQQLEGALARMRQDGLLQMQALDEFATLLARHYAELDYLHPFIEGNSRTLRTFTRQLASASDLLLDWGANAANAQARDTLYKARDVEVLRRAWPGLCREQADALPDNAASRAHYEAYYLGLYKIEHAVPLQTLIRQGLQAAARPVLRLIK
jgi:fido (protein-threonine AMPylation protein)